MYLIYIIYFFYALDLIFFAFSQFDQFFFFILIVGKSCLDLKISILISIVIDGKMRVCREIILCHILYAERVT